MILLEEATVEAKDAQWLLKERSMSRRLKRYLWLMGSGPLVAFGMSFLLGELFLSSSSDRTLFGLSLFLIAAPGMGLFLWGVFGSVDRHDELNRFRMNKRKEIEAMKPEP